MSGSLEHSDGALQPENTGHGQAAFDLTNVSRLNVCGVLMAVNRTTGVPRWNPDDLKTDKELVDLGSGD